MRLLVYDMLVNVNGIYYVHVCEQARWARSAGNSAIEKLCIIIIIIIITAVVCLDTRQDKVVYLDVDSLCRGDLVGICRVIIMGGHGDLSWRGLPATYNYAMVQPCM